MPVFWFAFTINLFILFKVEPSSKYGVCVQSVKIPSWILCSTVFLPCMVLAFQNVSVYMRYIRSSTIQQLEEDYVQIQYAYGVLRRKPFYLITYFEMY
ncbi:hypothetical protein ACT7DH_04010 [Bacillus pacificus]